ncbi:hypothetical protein QE152_g38037 [Popillia japonica]|uniref:Uncharacterized protein n=1 Tax=Popillia japonica TaxID=7064 RepID=A0AAW1I833_POPJA
MDGSALGGSYVEASTSVVHDGAVLLEPGVPQENVGSQVGDDHCQTSERVVAGGSFQRAHLVGQEGLLIDGHVELDRSDLGGGSGCPSGLDQVLAGGAVDLGKDLSVADSKMDGGCLGWWSCGDEGRAVLSIWARTSRSPTRRWMVAVWVGGAVVMRAVPVFAVERPLALPPTWSSVLRGGPGTLEAAADNLGLDGIPGRTSILAGVRPLGCLSGWSGWLAFLFRMIWWVPLSWVVPLVRLLQTVWLQASLFRKDPSTSRRGPRGHCPVPLVRLLQTVWLQASLFRKDPSTSRRGPRGHCPWVGLSDGGTVLVRHSFHDVAYYFGLIPVWVESHSFHDVAYYFGLIPVWVESQTESTQLVGKGC